MAWGLSKSNLILQLQTQNAKYKSSVFPHLVFEANMTIGNTIILVLFTTNIINGNLEHCNLVATALQDGIWMALIVHQCPMDFVSEFNRAQSSKQNQIGYERKQTDSRVRIVRKRNFNLF